MTAVETAQTYLDEQSPRNHAAQSFAYFGDLPLGESWAYVWGRHRDSDVLEVSNYEHVLKTLREKFGDEADADGTGGEWRVEGSSHWAVGWVDNVAVRVLKDPSQGAVDDNLTEVFLHVLDLKDEVEAYPVLDEDDFSAREEAEVLENLKWEVEYRQRQGTCPQYVTVDAVYQALNDLDLYARDADSSDIDAAIEYVRATVAQARRARLTSRKALPAGQSA